MEILKTIGFTDAEIAGTPEEHAAAFERIKTAIVEGVKNDPNNYKAIADQAKFDALKIAEKKIAKILGVTAEKDDDLDAILKKGKEFLTAGTEAKALEIQNELIKAKAEYDRLKNEEMPAAIEKERKNGHAIYIDNALTLAAAKLDKSTLLPEDRLTIGRTKLNALGIELSVDENKKVIAKAAVGGLKPQIGDKTFEFNDIEGLFATVLGGYDKQSNGGEQTPTAGKTGGKIVTALNGGELSDYAKGKIAELNELTPR